MKLWNKETKVNKNIRPDRIQKMADDQLRGWLNASIMEMGACYDRWLYSRGESEDFTKILDIVNDLWNELQSRELK